MQKPFSIFTFTACTALAACTTTTLEVPGVYVMDIQQGNIVTQDMVDQLRPSMSKKQVLYIMGSPMLIDPFHQKRWDYIYAEKPGGEVRKQKRIALLFEGDELVGVQGDFRPSSVPVIPISKDVTVDVPKRESTDTLWDNLTALFKGSETEAAAKAEPDEKTGEAETKEKAADSGKTTETDKAKSETPAAETAQPDSPSPTESTTNAGNAGAEKK